MRYAPFWAIPVIIICLQFSYVYWLKAQKGITLILALIALISISSLVFYIWVGGPHKVDMFLIKNEKNF